MKITIYELLGMVKDGKAPKKIKYKDTLYEYDSNNGNFLNDEVEILEEEKKIPEKMNLELDDWTTPSQCDIELSKKIDEIIDYLKSKGRK